MSLCLRTERGAINPERGVTNFVAFNISWVTRIHQISQSRPSVSGQWRICRRYSTTRRRYMENPPSATLKSLGTKKFGLRWFIKLNGEGEYWLACGSASRLMLGCKDTQCKLFPSGGEGGMCWRSWRHATPEEITLKNNFKDQSVL